MRTGIWKVCFCLLLAMGCVTAEALPPVVLPQNYENAGCLQRYLIGVEVSELPSKSNMLQDSFKRILIEQLEQSHRVNILNPFKGDCPHPNRNPDIILGVGLFISKRQAHKGTDAVITYEVEATVSAESTVTRTTLFEERCVVREKGSGPSEEETRVKTMLETCAKHIAAKIIKLFPVGGTVTTITAQGDQMTFHKGQDHGFMPNQKVVLYIKNNGFDIPIALATVTPEATTATLKVDCWNHTDEDAEMWIATLKKAPEAFLKTTPIYIVTIETPAE